MQKVKGVPVSDEEKARLKAKRRKRRLWVYGSLIVGLIGAYKWQPMELDVFARPVPDPNPLVDPDRATLFAKGTKVLLVTAHPDDSEFYLGGTLWQLGKTAEIHQVICTDGDKAYYGIFADADENRRVRKLEAQAANTAWGGKGVDFLGHPDGRLRADEELVDQLVKEMERFRPDYVIAFDGEYPPRVSHQDHKRSGDAALVAAKRSGIPKWCLLFATHAPNFVTDITDDWDKKKELLAIHRSQWTGERFERVSNLVASFAEGDGNRFGIGLGEGMRVVKIRD